MAEAMADTTTVVVMAKSAVPGRVKSRLIGLLSAQQAAKVHSAMLRCVLDRAGRLIGENRQIELILAIDAGQGGMQIGVEVPDGWTTVDQGTGDLGRRIGWVWQRCGPGSVVFLGADSPDVPGHAMQSIVAALAASDAVIGPTQDGGYWTLAANRYRPQLLTGVDWGSDRVYHQTRQAAKRAGVVIRALEPWFDVDTTLDLQDLRQRLAQGRRVPTDPADRALECLRCELDRICGNLPYE